MSYEDDYPFDNETEQAIPVRAAPNPGDDDFEQIQGAIFHAWHYWASRMRTQRGRHGKNPSFGAYYLRQYTKLAEALRLAYGQIEPSEEWFDWRKEKLKELGRTDEMKDMEVRQPWEWRTA